MGNISTHAPGFTFVIPRACIVEINICMSASLRKLARWIFLVVRKRLMWGKDKEDKWNMRKRKYMVGCFGLLSTIDLYTIEDV